MELACWQARLERHFQQFRTERWTGGRDRQIFALEHGLDQNESTALVEEIRAHILRSASSPDPALPWIIYAAEIGYQFSGDQY